MATIIKYNTIQVPVFDQTPKLEERLISFSLKSNLNEIISPKLLEFINKNNKFQMQSYDLENIFSVNYNNQTVSLSSFLQTMAISSVEFWNSLNFNFAFDVNNNLKEITNPDDLIYIKSKVLDELKKFNIAPIDSINILSFSCPKYEYTELDTFIPQQLLGQTNNLKIKSKLNKTMGNNIDKDVILSNETDKQHISGIFARQIEIYSINFKKTFNVSSKVKYFEFLIPAGQSASIKIRVRNLYKKAISEKIGPLTFRRLKINTSKWTAVAETKIIDNVAPNKIIDLTCNFISDKKCLLSWNSDNFYTLNHYEFLKNKDIIVTKNRYIEIIEPDAKKSYDCYIMPVDDAGNNGEKTYFNIDFLNKKITPGTDNVLEKRKTSMISSFNFLTLTLEPSKAKSFNNLTVSAKDLELYGSDKEKTFTVDFKG